MMKYINTLLSAALLCAALILAGCADIMSPSAGLSHNARGLKITVSNDTADSRTLFPTANFTKYVLSFSGAAANNLAEKTLENGQTSTVISAGDLGAGDLTITAKGYVMINGTEYEAAEGSYTVTISTGPLPAVNIPLSARKDGADGHFSYSVSFPSAWVNDAYLEIYSLSGGSDKNCDLKTQSSGSFSLAPGYYRMTIRLYTNDETAGLTEIVHIYSNMETKANYTFTDADFTNFITLSGTIDVKVNGQVPSNIILAAFLDENYNNYLGQWYLENWDYSNGNWSIRLAASDTPIPLYFIVVADYNGGWFFREIGNKNVTVGNADKPNINLGTVNFNAITLSGTVDVKVGGNTPSQAEVHMYFDENYDNHSTSARVNLNDGTWSVTMEPFETATTLYFRIETYYNNRWFYKGTDTNVTVQDQDKPNINLGTVNFSAVTLSGTVDVKVNGETPSQAEVRIYDENYHYTSAEINLNDGTWSVTMEPFETAATLYFRIETYYNNGWFSKETGISVTVQDQNKPNINLGTVSFNAITLSGTVDVKVGGNPPSNAYVQMYLDENYNIYLTSAWLNLNDGTWSVTIEPFETAATLYFTIRTYYNNRWFSKGTGINVTVQDQDKPNIDLGTVNFNAITLSGTVDVKVGGNPPSQAEVQIYLDENYHSYLTSARVNLKYGTWSVTMEPFETATTLYFAVYAGYNNGRFYKGTGINVTVQDQNKPNINLGTVNFNAITLSGTLNITYGGSPVNNVGITAYTSSQQVSSFWFSSPEADTPWSMSLPAFDAPTDIIFRVNAQGSDANGNWFSFNGSVTVSGVYNQDISGINIVVDDPFIPVNPVSLAENAWANGNITAPYAIDWYSIDVTAGTTYYLWFNHSGNGDYTQSLYGEIYAGDEDGSEIFNTNNAWSTPVSFTAGSSGTVYVRVRNMFEQYGTYELIYSTASNRPVRGTANYVVTFNSMGGSAVNGGNIPARNVASGAVITRPADPVKDGYRFGGWYTDTTYTAAWDFATDTVSGPATLYAKWDPKVDNTIVVAFENPGDESIDLTASSTSISRSKNQRLQVTVEGEWDSYDWYVDGRSYGYGYWGGIDIWAPNLPVGIHTVSAVVTRGGKPYSKELTFKVVH
jgi:uncharacterized repeat protein (TIGR02543 family)